MYVCTCSRSWPYTCTCTCLYHMYILTYVCNCMCVIVCVYVCMCVCVYVCMCVCACFCSPNYHPRVRASAHVRTRACQAPVHTRRRAVSASRTMPCESGCPGQAIPPGQAMPCCATLRYATPCDMTCATCYMPGGVRHDALCMIQGTLNMTCELRQWCNICVIWCVRLCVYLCVVHNATCRACDTWQLTYDTLQCDMVCHYHLMYEAIQCWMLWYDTT